MSPSPEAKRPWGSAKALANLTFLLLGASTVSYLIAAHLYPGGAQFDPSRQGYSHLSNYLCDVFQTHPYGHSNNPARPFGIGALVFLSLALLPLSLNLPRLMQPSSLAARWAPIFGSLGSMSGCLVFTSAHDWAIEVGFAAAAFALSLSLVEMGRTGYVRLVGLGLWPVIVGGLNFILWKLQLLVPIIPLVQKIAISGLFLWSICVSLVTASRDLSDPHTPT